MHKLPELVELVEKSSSHIYEILPNTYNGKRWRIYKKPGELYQLAPYVEGEKWEEIKWKKFHYSHILEALNEFHLDVSVFHNIVLNHLLTSHYVAEHWINEIEKIIDAKTIQKFHDGIEEFGHNLRQVIEKTLKRQKFKVVKNEINDM